MAKQKEREKSLKDERDAIARERQDESGGDGFFSSMGRLFGDIIKDTATFRLDDAYSDTKDNVVQIGNSHAFWRDLEVGASDVLKAVQTAVTVAAAAAVAGPAGAYLVLKDPDSVFAKACEAGGEAALTAFTGGAAGAVIIAASIALSVGGELVADTKIFGDTWSQYVGMGMEVGGTVVAAAGGDGSKVAKVMQVVSGAERGVEGASQVAEGLARVEVASSDANAIDEGANAKHARFHVAFIDRTVKSILEDAKETQQSHQRAMSAIQGAIQTHDATLVSVSAMKG